MPYCPVHLKAARPTDPAYPKSIQKIGDHVRKRRLDLGLLQKSVAKQLKVSETTIWQWENNESRPALRCMPSIIEFLGYNPIPITPGVVGKILAWRTQSGTSRRNAARLIGVDETTLARWERSERKPQGGLLRQVQQFLKNQ